MQAYCMKCRAKKEMKDAKSITMKNGKPATQGVCPTCGTKMFRIGKGQATPTQPNRTQRGWMFPLLGCPALLFCESYFSSYCATIYFTFIWSHCNYSPNIEYLPNQQIFTILTEVELLIEQQQAEYNQIRADSLLRYRLPAPEEIILIMLT